MIITIVFVCVWSAYCNDSFSGKERKLKERQDMDRVRKLHAKMCVHLRERRKGEQRSGGGR